LAKGLVKVVHLCHDAAYDHDDEYVCRGVCELIVPCEGHFEGDTECLDGHNGDGSGCRADGQVYQRILAAMLGRNLVDHDGAESGDKCAIEEKTLANVLVAIEEAMQDTYRA
jgi:hypothetical protein